MEKNLENQNEIITEKTQVQQQQQLQQKVQNMKCQIHQDELIKRICILQGCSHFLQPVCLECAFMFHKHSTETIIPINELEQQLSQQLEDINIEEENEEVNHDVLENISKIKKQMKIFTNEFEQAEQNIEKLLLDFSKVQKESYSKVEAKKILLKIQNAQNSDEYNQNYQKLPNIIQKIQSKDQQQKLKIIFQNQFSQKRIKNKEQEIQYRLQILRECQMYIEQQIPNIKKITQMYKKFDKQNVQNHLENCVCDDLIILQNQGCEACNKPPRLEILGLNPGRNQQQQQYGLPPPPPPPPFRSLIGTTYQQAPQLPPPILNVPQQNSYVGQRQRQNYPSIQHQQTQLSQRVGFQVRPAQRNRGLFSSDSNSD